MCLFSSSLCRVHHLRPEIQKGHQTRHFVSAWVPFVLDPRALYSLVSLFLSQKLGTLLPPRYCSFLYMFKVVVIKMHIFKRVGVLVHHVVQPFCIGPERLHDLICKFGFYYFQPKVAEISANGQKVMQFIEVSSVNNNKLLCFSIGMFLVYSASCNQIIGFKLIYNLNWATTNNFRIEKPLRSFKKSLFIYRYVSPSYWSSYNLTSYGPTPCGAFVVASPELWKN